MRIMLVHATGNMNTRQVLFALWEARVLGQFWTTLTWTTGTAWDRLLPRSLRNALERRSFPWIPSSVIRLYPFAELGRLIGSSLGIRMLTEPEKSPFNIFSVCESLDRRASREIDRDTDLSGVYCYEDGAFHTFSKAAERGLTRYYDLPIAYWETSRRLMQEEAARLPRWSATMQGLQDSKEKLDRKTGELKLADVVICPSEFVMDSLPESIRREKRCVLARFGCAVDRKTGFSKRPGSGPLRVLFVGALSQRKGLADLFAAMQLLNAEKRIELHVLGSPQVDLDFYRSEFQEFVYHRPRPHGDVLAFMRECDVFVLPSIVEGRALVQLEALSCGLPLIVTRNAGGDDLIIEGETGFLVPIRSPSEIAGRLEWFLEDPKRVERMRPRCMEHARSTNWKSYRQEVISAVCDGLEKANLS